MAAEFYKEAADKGYPPAMNNYAVLLLRGDGIPQNKKQAIHYLKMAAKKGDQNALKTLKEWSSSK